MKATFSNSTQNVNLQLKEIAHLNPVLQTFFLGITLLILFTILLKSFHL